MPARDPHPKAKLVVCVCGCGESFHDLTPYGRPRRWASARCRNRTSIALSPAAQQNKRDRETVRREKVVGRECRWCGTTDSERPWGAGTIEECENCRRQRSKHRCARCDGPVYVYPFKSRKAGCVLRNRLGSCDTDT